tara:strand:- start:513 stop:932 length:420 start_codon:yes stop_codon:yes gene_type:complete
MGRLNDSEINSLLSEPVISFITTLNADGSPHTSPVWHSIEKEILIVATQPQTIKVKNIRNDPRVSLVVAVDRIPQPWVQVNGKATIRESEDIDRIVTDLSYRYLGPEDAPEYLNVILGKVKFVLIEIEPEKILGFDGIE